MLKHLEKDWFCTR